MSKSLLQSKRDIIKTRLEEEIPHSAIVDEMNVSLQTIKNYSASLKTYDTVILPSTSQRGCKPILTREMVEIRIPKTQSDRKSTRLNSSHTVISYAVFCL